MIPNDWPASLAFAAETTLAVTLLVCLVLLVRKPVAKRFGAGAAYALWSLPLIRLVLPPLPSGWLPRPLASNGEAVTQYLYGCEVGKAGAEGGFCPLSALAETVRKLGVEFDSTCGEYPYASAQSGRGG